MRFTEEQARKVLEIVREYRANRDIMTSPLNLRRASHMEFILFCNENALKVQKELPLVTFEEYLALYRLASGSVPGWRADRLWADYETDDQNALTELLGVLLGVLRQQRR